MKVFRMIIHTADIGSLKQQEVGRMHIHKDLAAS